MFPQSVVRARMVISHPLGEWLLLLGGRSTIGETLFLETSLSPWEDRPGRALGSQDGEDKGHGREELPCGHASSQKEKRKVPGAASWVLPDLVGEA